jgi:hypothetical protein
MDNQQQENTLNSTAKNHIVGSGIPKGKQDGAALSPDQIAPKGYLSFAEARKFAVTLQLKTRKEWRQYIKGEMPQLAPKPANIPAHPDGIYKIKGWQGWKYWLGTAGHE